MTSKRGTSAVDWRGAEEISSGLEEIVIIGTGFVGLPLALLLADRGMTVIGVDTDEDLVREIRDQSLRLDEKHLDDLLRSDRVKENLKMKTSPESGDAFVVSVPTPIRNPQKSPDLSYVKAAIDSILPYLEDQSVINIESTVPPLTCENVVRPLIEDEGFTLGEDIYLAHSPERILPGNVFEELVHNDRVIGGINEESSRRAACIYEPFLEGDVYYTDLLSAELCKLLENTFRDVNVALANEFALIGEELGITIDRVIELANNHPRVDILQPGIGVGGHCLPVDPWFLNEVDPEHTNLITTARRINDMMPSVATRKVRHALCEYMDPKVLALGAAYKPNTYDPRNSPAKRIVEELRHDGYDVEHFDRLVDGMEYDDLQALIDTENPEVILQLVPHDSTVKDLNQLSPWIDQARIDLLQFGLEGSLDP